MSETTSTGLYETPADAGTDDRGAVRLWLDAVTLARKTEEDWRKRADAAIDRYRDEKEVKAKRFNILYANTQILLPSLYNSTPTPDVRRRHGDADPVGKVAAQVLERGLAYSTDAYDFDAAMRAVVLDMILPGRGVARVRYDATEAGAQTVTCDYVDWRDFIPGPGRQWGEVPWIAFEHRLTREQLVAQFGAIGQTMPMDVVTGDHGKTDPRDVPEVFKRATVYEIWDKQAREVLFLAPAVPDRMLRRVPDPLSLSDFWPVPRPVYDVMDSGSLVPLVPYELYKEQAEELDKVTARINALVAMCRYRGLRAGDLVELSELAEAKDGDFVPVENAQQYMAATGGGGLERAMWTTPIEIIANVIAQLEAHRMAVKETIYEITGLSDILRGATVASETATAQQIKSQFGSLRIQDRQREVQRFARDLYRLKAEIMGERFEPENLAVMTGIELPTPEQKMAAMQAGQPIDAPTWPEVMEVLHSDAMRAYRVDIETDSTIQADVARAQQNAAQFVQGFGGFITAIGPAVQAGAMPMDVVADLLTAFARSYKLGRQAEDALERLGQQARQPQPQGDDGAAAEAAQADRDAQTSMAQMQADAQTEQARLAADGQKALADAIAGATAEETARQAATQAHELKMAEAANKAAAEARKLDLEERRVANEERKTGIEERRMRNEPVSRVVDAADGMDDPTVNGLREMLQAPLAQPLAAIGEALAALAAQNQAILAAVRSPRRVQVERGPDGMIAGATQVPMEMVN
jgi:hypothetical protein